MGLNILTLGSSKTYTRESLLGGGAVVGKNVTISSITPIEGGNRVTFSYTLDNGTVKTSTMDVMDGKDGVDGLPGKNGKDGQPGKDGSDGIGISKIEKIGTVDLVDTYRITFTDNSTFDYEVTNGKDGQGGTGGSGEENTIESISVNGTPISVDSNKNVDITVPTVTNDLTDELKSSYDDAVTAKHTHENGTVLDGITAEKVESWDKAEENIIESVKINNQEITPDDNKAVNIDLTGYAEHDEIVGENLIPFPYAQPERTTNGITFTFADDGSVIANGTATENADFSVCVRTNFGTDAALMLKPGIYAITGCPEGGSDSTYRIQVQFGDKTELKYSLKADYGKGFVFEVTEEYAQYACQIQCHVQKGYTVTDLVFKPMLVLGSVLKEYQPYKLSRESLRTDIADVTELASRVDNQFSTASGDSITVNDSVDGKLVELGVKGNSFQKSYSGKNLLKYPYAQTTRTHNGVTFTDVGDGSIIANRVDSTITEKAYFQPTFRLGDNDSNLFLEDGDYTMYCFGGDEYCYLEIFATKADESGTVILGDTKNGGILNFTVTNSEYANNGQLGVTFYVKTEATVSNRTFKFMICKGTLDNTEMYESYVGGVPSPNPLYPQTINSVGDDGSLVVTSCGKNIIPFPYYNGSDIRVGVTATVNLDSSITLKGTATSNYFFVLLHRNANGKGFAKKLRGKTVTISGGTSRPVLSFAVYDEDGNNVTPPNNEMLYDYGSGVTVTIPDNACDMYSYYYFSSGNVVDVTLRPQLEVSNVVTEYEPYKSSTSTIPLSEPLRAIGDIKDEITYQDGKWGVLRRTGKYVVDGTESWVLDSDHIVDCGISVRLGGYTNILKGISSVTGNTKDMITDYLRCIEYETIPYYATSNSVQEDKGSGTYRTPGNIWISFGASDIEKMGITKDIDSVKAWLSSHNITFIYPLGTPVFEPFSDQTLPYLSTYDGVTNISNDDALSAEMTVKYPTTDASGVGSRNESRIAELEETKADKCKVADVTKTNIELIDTTNYTVGDNSGYSFYQVINGICYVDLLLTCVTPINGNTSAPGHLSLPKARSSFHATLIGANGTTDNIVQYVGASGVSFFKYGTAGKLYVGHFSYPVAES